MPELIANNRIDSPKVLVIDETGNNLGLLDTSEAIRIANEKELDLVLVSKQDDVVVTRIADVAKLKYEKTKKLKKNKSRNVQNKEWWFKPSIQDRDLILRLEKVKKFVEKGGNAKLTLRYVAKTPYNQMYDTMNKIVSEVSQFAKPINTITKEGRNLSITVKALK